MKLSFSIFFIVLSSFQLFGQIEKDLVPYRIKNKWGYSDFEQNIKIKAKYDSVGLHETYRPLGNKIAFVKKRKRIGVIDESGKFLIPLKYSSIIQEGRTGTTWNHETDKFLVKLKNQFGIVNIKDSVVIPIKYDTLFIKDDSKGNSYVYFGKRDNKYYKLSENDIELEISQEKFVNRRNTSSGAVEYYSNEDQDSNTEITKWKSSFLKKYEHNLDSTSESITHKNLFFFKTYRKGKVGIIGQIKNNEKKYDFSIPPKYNALLNYDVKREYPKYYFVFLVKMGKEIGVIDYTDKTLMPFKPISYDYFNAYHIYTKKDGLLGFYRFEDKTNIEPKYEYLKPYTNLGLLKVKKDGKWGYINDNGIEYFKNCRVGKGESHP